MKLKLVHITLSMGTGGLENCIYHLVRTLDPGRFDLEVGCLDYGGELLGPIHRLGIPTFIERREPGLDWQLILRLARYFRRKRIHIVHTHNQAAHFYAGIAARLARVPILITTEHSRHHIEGIQRRQFEKKILYRITDQWVTVSPELYRESVGKEFFSPDRLSMIPNGIPIDGYNVEDRKKVQIKSQLGLAEDTKVVTMVARLDPIKNHGLMLRSFSIICKKNNKIHLLLAGDGKDLDSLKQMACDLDISEKVHFLGIRQDVPELLGISDLFVLCSQSEGLPLSLLEAAAARVPAVITPLANKAGFIGNQKTGSIVKAEPGDMATLLIDILERPDQYRGMTEAAYEKVCKHFSVHSMTAAYEHLYYSLARKKGKFIKT